VIEETLEDGVVTPYEEEEVEEILEAVDAPSYVEE